MRDEVAKRDPFSSFSLFKKNIWGTKSGGNRRSSSLKSAPKPPPPPLPLHRQSYLHSGGETEASLVSLHFPEKRGFFLPAKKRDFPPFFLTEKCTKRWLCCTFLPVLNKTLNQKKLMAIPVKFLTKNYNQPFSPPLTYR